VAASDARGDGALEGDEGEALAGATRRARRADRALAAALRRPQPSTRATSPSYLDELGRRARLPEALERRLIVADYGLTLIEGLGR